MGQAVRKPKRRIVRVTYVHWLCGYNHNHDTKAEARNCIQEQIAKKRAIPRRIALTLRRRAKAHRAYRGVVFGWSYWKAGKSVGLSAKQVRRAVRDINRFLLKEHFGPKYPARLYTLKHLRKWPNHFIGKSLEFQKECP
jgi:hypothetical protein